MMCLTRWAKGREEGRYCKVTPEESHGWKVLQQSQTNILVAEVWVVDVTVPLVASFLKVEEDLQGSSQTKEETDGTELKQEPMEIEEKKPEMKVEAKEEEESGTNGTTSQSTSPSQPRKKSTCMKTEFPCVLCFH